METFIVATRSIVTAMAKFGNGRPSGGPGPGVEMMGFEPTTSSMRTKRSAK